MTEFSIIIPIYNAEKTLRKCLDSILRQTFSDYEVILVDDGSKDDSLKICESYCAEDKRFSVFHQENSGPSKARNYGLDKAQGEYVCFIDSDDTITSDYLEKIHHVASMQDAQVIFIGYRQMDELGNEKDVCLRNNLEKEKMNLLIELSEKDMFGYTWIKSFMRKAIGDVRFEQGLDLFEDEIFTCQVMETCEHIGIVSHPIYNYVTGVSGALTGRTYQDYCQKCEKLFEAWGQLVKTCSDKQEILTQKANNFVTRCYYYGMERDVDLKNFFRELRNTSFFAIHTSVNPFDRYIVAGKYNILRLTKMSYHLKQFLRKCLKRS